MLTLEIHVAVLGNTAKSWTHYVTYEWLNMNMNVNMNVNISIML